AGAAGGVHLQHVREAVFSDRLADRAVVSGPDCRASRPIRACVVDGLGDDTGGSGLPNTAHTRQDDGMREPLAFNRIRQGADESLLANKVSEGLRPILTRQYAIGR